MICILNMKLYYYNELVVTSWAIQLWIALAIERTNERRRVRTRTKFTMLILVRHSLPYSSSTDSYQC